MGLADSFDPTTGRNIKWTARLGTETHSTPVIAKGRVIVGSNNRKPRDPQHQTDLGVLMCFDEKEKKLIGEMNLDSPISSSPVAANGLLYVTTMTHLYAVQKEAVGR
jgi:outer membrane protein assembly factor BamB